ncbi:AmiS/UreI family transporter [Corynebacterium sp. A21]|uniref:AmiS/UreI family transporter n=1 Tax=Corynebacterium sp. A21 TaxID=3457318 RepID=UPI003FD3C245
MASLALLFVGAVLLVNGLVFLGCIDAKAAIPINLLTGFLLVFAAILHLTAVSPTSPDYRAAGFAAVGYTLFGFTYLTVGANSLFGGTGTALGWYCGWAAVIAAVLAVVNFADGSNSPIAWLWVAWTVLFFSFFLALITGVQQLSDAAGLLAIIHSVTTASIPGLLMIHGSWSSTSITVVGIVQIVSIIIYIYVAVAAPLRRKTTAAAVPQSTKMSVPAL